MKNGVSIGRRSSQNNEWKKKRKNERKIEKIRKHWSLKIGEKIDKNRIEAAVEKVGWKSSRHNE